ncbi:endolytic transglycosylase MltG [Aurantimicrobium minutum]|uniref:endolytic transglycosylase MltG n=1 Tax=Aurantimicrobium minutum TaxID=708131 RepID=UPI002475EDDC|nr:endolytic transglycosylase MltG [Aurantimicrobium minutum]
MLDDQFTPGPTPPSASTFSDVPSHAAGKRRKSSRNKPALVIGSIIGVLVLVGAVLGGLFYTGILGGSQNDYSGGGHGEVIFTIGEGEIGDQIANNLVEAGVTKSFESFYQLLLETTPEPVFTPGVYKLKLEMSAQSALDALLDPANRVELTVTIPEGTTEKNVLKMLAEGLSIPLADFEAAVANPAEYGVPEQATTLEGFLFPATYTFSPGVTANAVIQRLVDESLAALDSAGVPTDQRWETIIMASVIQRESGPDPEDLYKISRVFHNRLEQGMTMGSDVTTCYGAGLIGKDCLLITQAALDDTSNLYNTRILTGLPIGPISNPGAVAIDAAFNPTEGPWLFFVTVNLTTGETVFTETAAEHEAAVEQYYSWLEAHPEAVG